MTKFVLTRIDGQKLYWNVREYLEDTRGHILAFTSEYTTGTAEHFYLAHPLNKLAISRSITAKISGSALAEAVGKPVDAPGVVEGALIHAIAAAVLEYISSDENGEHYYYSQENDRQVFHGPLIMKNSKDVEVD